MFKTNSYSDRGLAICRFLSPGAPKPFSKRPFAPNAAKLAGPLSVAVTDLVLHVWSCTPYEEGHVSAHFRSGFPTDSLLITRSPSPEYSAQTGYPLGMGEFDGRNSKDFDATQRLDSLTRTPPQWGTA